MRRSWRRIRSTGYLLVAAFVSLGLFDPDINPISRVSNIVGHRNGGIFAQAIEDPVEFVNLLAGTFTDGRQFSTGNTLPLVGMPWGFNHWAPQTKEQNGRSDSWWFDGNDHAFAWMRCTHQPSPWIGDYAWFLFAPMVGGLTKNPKAYWEPRAAHIKPHIFDAILAPHGIRLELAPTMHAAAVRVTFPSASSDKRVCFREANFQRTLQSPARIFGENKRVSIDRMLVSNFAMAIYVESVTTARAEQVDGMACLVYDSNAEVVEFRVATSFISHDQATVSLHREAPTGLGTDGMNAIAQMSFDEVAAVAKGVWNNILGRVNVRDPGEISERTNRYLTVFYTGLARAFTFPRRLDETDASGRVFHYSPYDPQGGRNHVGLLLTDNGFWDTFRTVYPLYGLLYPDLLGDIIQGWLGAFREGGWLPSWASPGYRNCMVGTFGDVIVADAMIKDIPGFDKASAVQAIRKDAFESPPAHAGGAVGKEGLQQYVSLGYVPHDNDGETVSRTLDFGFADMAVAEALHHASEDESFVQGDISLKEKLIEEANTLYERSKRAVTSLYNKDYGLMVPRRSNGGFALSRFDPAGWGNGFTEGSAWHHSFPPYSVDVLAGLHGGKQKLLNKLHEMFKVPSTFGVGSYGQVIHEMSEFRALSMGQYGHNNQPSHHILYMFAMLGEAETTQKYVREVMDRAYGPDFFAGDEDNGEQGAWFVLSALGLYSTAPGASANYVLGSPIFKHVQVHRKRNADGSVAVTHLEDVIQDITREVVSRRQVNGGASVASIRGAAAVEARPQAIDDKLASSSGKRSAIYYNNDDSSEILDIIAPRTGPNAVKVRAVYVNGRPLASASSWQVSHKDIIGPGILQFMMEDASNTGDGSTGSTSTSAGAGIMNSLLSLVSGDKKAYASTPIEAVMTKDQLYAQYTSTAKTSGSVAAAVSQQLLQEVTSQHEEEKRTLKEHLQQLQRESEALKSRVNATNSDLTNAKSTIESLQSAADSIKQYYEERINLLTGRDVFGKSSSSSSSADNSTGSGGALAGRGSASVSTEEDPIKAAYEKHRREMAHHMFEHIHSDGPATANTRADGADGEKFVTYEAIGFVVVLAAQFLAVLVLISYIGNKCFGVHSSNLVINALSSVLSFPKSPSSLGNGYSLERGKKKEWAHIV